MEDFDHKNKRAIRGTNERTNEGTEKMEDFEIPVEHQEEEWPTSDDQDDHFDLGVTMGWVCVVPPSICSEGLEHV